MSAELAATPGNFDSFLSTADAPTDNGSDNTPQEFHDSTGPSNTNAWAQDASTGDQSDYVNPERRAPGDAEDPTADSSNEYSELINEGEEQAEELEGQPDQQQEEQPEDEQQTPEGMPSYEDLQGMFQVTQAPELHDYFYDKLVPVTVNGVRMMKTVREATDGYMRMSDYSRGQQQNKQEREENQQYAARTRSVLQRMADPRAFVATLRHLGPQHMQAFQEAAKQWGKEMWEYRQMTPEARAAFDANKAREESERQLAELRAQQQRERQQRQSPAAQYAPVITQALDSVVPAAWQRHGIVDNELSQSIFMNHVQSMWDSNIESIPAVVERAAVATKEQLSDLAMRYGGQPPQAMQQRPANTNQRAAQQPMQRQQAPAQPLPPRRVPAGPVARPANSNGGGDTRYRGTNFNDYLKQLDRR